MALGWSLIWVAAPQLAGGNMSKESAIALGKLKSQFRRLPLPDKFSRLVSLLLDHLSREHQIAWPSRSRLAALMGCSEKTIQRNLSAVRTLGLFYMENVGADEMRCRIGLKRKDNRHTYTLYKLNWKHPLWKGEGLGDARQVIQQATWRGVEKRCSKQIVQAAEPCEASSEADSALLKTA